MSKLISTAKEQIKTALESAIKNAQAENKFPQAQIPEYTIEVPADKANGDFAANIAMVCARAFRSAPRMIAQEIVSRVSCEGTYFERVAVAGPGFINFYLNQSFYTDVLVDIDRKKGSYGRSDFGRGQKIMVEFVSANPTGPMHIGNARGGALGDCLASVLDYAGYDVTREFYINDAGNQIEKFAVSLEARYLQIYLGENAVPFPEDAYHGEDIRKLAYDFAKINGADYVKAEQKDRRRALVDFALPLNIKGLQTDLARYNINFDVWFNESRLHRNGELDQTIDLMCKRGLTYEKEGALWYKATEYGGEKDEVLIRANGLPTYFAVDIAYHRNKFMIRQFDRVINVWGADHHGHVARLKGAMDAIGLDGGRLRIVLMQMVRLIKDGQAVKISKRTGKAITLNTLLDEVPADAARFVFNSRETGTHLEFDLDLAVEQSAKNPVYYVQYAHARICSVIGNLAADGVSCEGYSADDLACLTSPEELDLIRQLSRLEDEIIAAADACEPARMTRYAIDTAALFHKFYNACRVKGEELPVMKARLLVCQATGTVLKNVLELMKISAPESM